MDFDASPQSAGSFFERFDGLRQGKRRRLSGNCTIVVPTLIP
jgi:hypothetical protein